MAITSAIVPYSGNKSSAIVKPQQQLVDDVQYVKVQDVTTKKSEDIGKNMRRTVVMLLRKRQERDRLEQKYFKLIDQNKEKKKRTEEEKKQESTSFLTGVGSGLKRNAEKLGGDLFGAIGDILGYLALDWISKPENQGTVENLIKGFGALLKFVDWWVTGSVDNLLSGLTSFLTGDSLLERFVGFMQLSAGILGFRYLLNPFKLIKDAKTLITNRKAITDLLADLGKGNYKEAFKAAFPKTADLVSKIKKRLVKIFKLDKVGSFVVNLGKRLFNMATKGGAGGALKNIMKGVFRPVSQALKKIPIVGPLVGFGLNVALGDPWDKAAVKAVGSSLGGWLGGGLGTLIFPGVGTFIGAFLGGLIGDWLGGRFYDLLSGKEAKKPTEDESKRAKLLALAEKEGWSPEKIDRELQKKGLAKIGETSDPKDTTLQPAGPSGPYEISLAKLLANYEGIRENAYADAIYGWKVPTIGIGATYYPPGFRLKGKVKKGDKITKDEAYWIKAQHIKQHRQRLLKEISSAEYNSLPDSVKAALESKVFNYGSLGAPLAKLVRSAVKSKTYGAISSYFRNTLAPHDKGVNAWRRNDEAGIIDSGRSKRVSSLSFKTKMEEGGRVSAMKDLKKMMVGGDKKTVKKSGSRPQSPTIKHSRPSTAKRMSDVSMNVVQDQKYQQPNVTVISYSQGGTTIMKHSTIASSTTSLNRNRMTESKRRL